MATAPTPAARVVEQTDPPTAAASAIDLAALRQEVAGQLERAAQQYHMLRGQLALIDRLIAQVSQAPIVRNGQDGDDHV